jgi:hypothetical protein
MMLTLAVSPERIIIEMKRKEVTFTINVESTACVKIKISHIATHLLQRVINFSFLFFSNQKRGTPRALSLFFII